VKVLHVFKTYLPDSFTGVERVIWEISEGLWAQGVESHVLSLSKKPEKDYRVGRHFGHQAKCDLYIASTGLSSSLFRAFREFAESVDVIHYHFPWPMMDLVHLREKPSRPTVVTYHSDIVRQRLLLGLYRPMMHRFLDSIDRIVATSPNYLETSPTLQRFKQKAVVIPIGLADQKPPQEPLVRHWRQQVGEGFFLFVGALRYYKGLPFLIEAARKTRLPVVIAGNGDLANEIGQQKLPNVTLLKSISDEDKAALLHLCGAFLFPSHVRSEAFGVALLEAARAGKPMISCEIGTGTSYVNLSGVTGFVVPPANPSALGEAMQKLFNEPSDAARMGEAARERYDRLFRAEVMCADYLALYKSLL